MSIMDSLKNMFGGPKTPSEQYAKDVEATHKHMQKVMIVILIRKVVIQVSSMWSRFMMKMEIS